MNRRKWFAFLLRLLLLYVSSKRIKLALEQNRLLIELNQFCFSLLKSVGPSPQHDCESAIFYQEFAIQQIDARMAAIECNYSCGKCLPFAPPFATHTHTISGNWCKLIYNVSARLAPASNNITYKTENYKIVKHNKYDFRVTTFG